MYHNYQKAQQAVCLICQRPIDQSVSFFFLLKRPDLCGRCCALFQVIHHHCHLLSYPLHILYYYNAFFRSLLYQYKGLDDYALKDAFLPFDRERFKQRYREYIVVVIPSFAADNDRRGYAPVYEIARTFSQQVFDGLYKTRPYKQSTQPYMRREDVEQVLAIRGGACLYGKKVLIFDDVITSGHTMRQAVSLVADHQPSCIELLVLATRRSLEEPFFPIGEKKDKK